MISMGPLRTLKHRVVYGSPASLAKQAARMRRQQRRLFNQVRSQLVLPELPALGGALCGIAMVKNEVDVIERSMRQLLEQGVDQLLVSDNGSTDGTFERLRELQAEMPLHVARDLMVAYEQSVKMTVLSDAVTDHGSEWVIPFDADELWLGRDGYTVREVLNASEDDIVSADLFNVFPRPAGGDTWSLDPSRHPDSKVSFRAGGGAVIEMGNHTVLRAGTVSSGLAIIHMPWRSFEQFERKIVQGSEAIRQASLPEDKGWHWRQLGLADTAARRHMWNELLRGSTVPGNAWSSENATVPFNIETLTPLPWDL